MESGQRLFLGFDIGTDGRRGDVSNQCRADATQGQSVFQDAACRRRLPTPIRRRKATKRHKSAPGDASYNEN
jgi:hypothetical protein